MTVNLMKKQFYVIQKISENDELTTHIDLYLYMILMKS